MDRQKRPPACEWMRIFSNKLAWIKNRPLYFAAGTATIVGHFRPV
jgi:hypothetical protein